MSGKRGLLTYYWALTGVFGALQFVMTAVPYSIAIGGTGGALTIGLISAPLIGFILGPIYGTLAVLIGSLLGMLVNPAAQIMGLLTALAPTAGALCAGAIRVKKGYVVPIVFSVAIIAFLVGPIGTLAFSFLWLHVVALLLSFVFVLPVTSRVLVRAIETPSKSGIMGPIVVCIVALIAVLGDHIVGSAIGGYYFHYVLAFDANTVADWFTAILFIYPVERILASLLCVALTYSVFIALESMNVPFPTQSDEYREFQEFPPDEPGLDLE